MRDALAPLWGTNNSDDAEDELCWGGLLWGLLLMYQASQRQTLGILSVRQVRKGTGNDADIG